MSPKRVDAGQLGHRPSSSSGPSTVEFKRTDFDKRKSRDDLYLMTMTAEKQQQKYISFHTPNRNRFLSVDSGGSKDQQASSSQQQRQRQKSAVTPMREQQQQRQQPSPYMLAPSPGPENEGLEGIAIGMALGSPAHPPVGAWPTWQPPGQAQSQEPATASPLGYVTTPEAPWTPDDPSLKPKGRKWGIFSRSKSKKGRSPIDTRETSSPQPPQPLQKPSSSQQRPQDARPGALRKGSGDSQASSSKASSSSASKPKYKPIVVPYEPRAPSPRTSPKPKASPQLQRPAYKLVPGVGARPTMAPAGPLLDVQIPDITMERYSIMFSQLLKKPPGQQTQETAAAHMTPRSIPMQPPTSSSTISSSSPSSSSSLLARRQATLGRLKTIEDEIVQQHESGPLEPPRLRRASSSQTKQSPALYLFPPNMTAGGAKPNSPRSRSFTSPAGMPLPSRPAPEPPIQRLEQSRAQTFPNIGMNASLTNNTMSSSAQGRPMLTSKFQRKESQAEIKVVGSMVDSPISMSMSESSPELARKESTLEAMTPPTSTTGSSSSTSKKDSLSSITSEIVSVTRPAEETVEDVTLKEAVQASISRQISVSREQRELLRPFRSQSRHGRKVKPLGVENIAIGVNERIVDTKKATPTLVHPAADALSPQSQNLYRRSEQVVFDAA